MRIFSVMLAQKLFRLFGLHVRRLEKGVKIDSAMEKQLRLAGNQVQCVFEIGAANGRDCVIYAQRCPEATIYAFEPLPANFKKLKEKAVTEPRIVAINAAVSSKSGTAPFYVTALDDASSLLPPRKTGSTFDKYMITTSEITVEVRTVDKECSARKISKIDILKMDAQGAELSILQGATKMLKKKSIKVIYLEVNFVRLYDGACLYHEIATFLAEYGYHLQNLYDLIHNQNGQLSWGNAIFVPLNN